VVQIAKKVGLVLGSGGARGYAHIGVIKVLLENDIPIDYISGASIGSVVGAYFALKKDVAGLENAVLSIKKQDLLRFVDFNDPRVSLIKSEKIRKFLNWLYEDKSFEDTKIPIKVVATSLESGKKIVIDSGKLIDAVMSSSAIPGIFPIVEYKKNHLIDGGISDGLPVDIAEKQGAQVIIAVDLYSYDYYEFKKNNVKEILERTYRILLEKLSELNSMQYKKNIILLQPKAKKGFGTFAFDNAKEKIAAGEKAAREALPKIMEMIKD
jgi:NTE family protein